MLIFVLLSFLLRLSPSFSLFTGFLSFHSRAIPFHSFHSLEYLVLLCFQSFVRFTEPPLIDLGDSRRSVCWPLKLSCSRLSTNSSPTFGYHYRHVFQQVNRSLLCPCSVQCGGCCSAAGLSSVCRGVCYNDCIPECSGRTIEGERYTDDGCHVVSAPSQTPLTWRRSVSRMPTRSRTRSRISATMKSKRH